MSYTITITRKKTEKKLVTGDWGVVGTKEVEREGQFCTGPNEPKTRIENVFGYQPNREKTFTEEIQVLSQTVEELNLPAVIKAINNL